nr:hypothetical protein [Tanacetum cinerariifolium]
MGQGSAHGSAPVDDDDSPVVEMSPVKKPSKRASRAKKNDAKDNEPAKDRTKAKEIALCRAYGSNDLDVYQKACAEYKMIYMHEFTLRHCYNILKDHQEDEYEEEAQEHRPLGRDASKAKKKSLSPLSKVSTAGEYELWRIRIEQYIYMVDYSLWEVMENGNTPPITQVVKGVETTIAPATAEEKAQKDAKSLLQAIEKRFGGNAATKKTQRNLLKQRYEIFTASSSEMAMLTMRARRFLKNTKRKFSSNENETIRFDKSKIECYNCHKKGHFARECRAPKSQDTKHKKSTKRNVLVETPASAALKIDKCKTGLGYNVVSPPYTGNFLPLKPDFSGLEEFVNEPIVSEHTVKKPAVETSEAKASADKSKVVKKNFGPSLIKDWISDSKDEAESKSKIEKKTVKPSFAKIEFVKSKEQVKSHRKTIVKQGKFNGKADEGFFIGYTLNSKAFRVFNNKTSIVEEKLHMRFSENTPNIAESGPNWIFDIDALTKSMNYKPVVTGKQSNVDEDPKQESECKDQEKEHNVNNTNNVNVVGKNGVNVVGVNTNNELPFDPEMSALEDISTFNFSSDHEDDVEEADINNMYTTIQVSPTLTKRIHKDHPLDQVIRDLHSTTQTRNMSKNLEEHEFVTNIHHRTNYKDLQNCLFGCFLSQKEPKKDERGIVIRNKARLVAQGYTQEEDIYYDEIFAPVARIEAIGLFLAYASFKDFVVYQMDVKSVFLYEKIEEEVYVCQPPGFEDPDFPDKVYKVKKALYGLHQAPRPWYKTLLTYLLDNGFYRGKIDKTLFIRRHKDDILLVQVYVDDTIFVELKKNYAMYLKMMHEKFQMSSMRELTFFLGLQKSRMQEHQWKLKSLCSRMKIVRSRCSHVNQKISHIHAVKRIFRCRLISWQCKKQTMFANSTTEAEYVAAKLSWTSTLDSKPTA